MTTTAVSKQRKKRSPAGRTPTPDVPAVLRELAALSSELGHQVELLQGLCGTLGVFAWAENLDGLSFEAIGKTALLMEEALGDVHKGLGKIEGLAEQTSWQTAA